MPVRPYDQNQHFLLPPSLSEWVKRDHPARIFSDIIERINITGFHEIKQEGRPRYDARMMLKILLWSYANGIRSSRKIEDKLYSDVVFMWLAGLEKPDFRTICLFRRSNLERLNNLFSEVILLAQGLKLVRLGLIALDGTKVRANVSVDSFKSLKDWADKLNKARETVKKILTEAEEADLEEDRKYGKDRRGDEIPKELEKEQERIKKIEELIKQRESKKANKTDKVSDTDSEAKFMHHKNGSIPAYNCELAVTKEQIIVHSDVTTEPIDTNQLTPALEGIKEVCGKKPKRVLADAGFNSGRNFWELEKRKIEGYIPEGSEENIGKDLKAHTGLYSKDDFQYEPEEDCYICPAGERLHIKKYTHKRTKYSDNWVDIYGIEDEKCLRCTRKEKCTKGKSRTISRGEFEFERLRMQQKLKTEEGKKIYKKRKTMVEPVVGQIKTVGGFIQFLLRGLIGAKIEWKWATIAHNLLKIARKIVRGERKISLLPI